MEVVETMRELGVIELQWGDIHVKIGALKPPTKAVSPMFAHSHMMPVSGLETP